MNFSEIGKIVETEWIKTPEIRFDMNLELGEFVIMPNHFHAIIIIGKNEYNANTNSIPNPNTVIGRGAMHCASTNDDGVPTDDGDNGGNQFGPQSKNLASIIRGFKSSVTTYARKNNLSFNWQPRFHDHIIRSMNDYHRMLNYILTNPQNWNEDSFNNIQDV
ncbi:MAG TPA: hypothetical protein VLZ75_04445 [Chitinophagales bacterium]|nr:hypothetical protein [Chitinophagales bacterium]